jgi:hypothetical protein
MFYCNGNGKSGDGDSNIPSNIIRCGSNKSSKMVLIIDVVVVLLSSL